MRPTMSPAVNTAMITNTSIPYSPEPTPPKITSPSCIRTSGTSPPSGVYESCIELTEPLEAAVVAAAQIVDEAMPKRASLPSMLPPGWSSEACWSAPAAVSAGLPPCSNAVVRRIAGTSTTSIAASSAHPCRRSRTMIPKVRHSAAGMSRIERVSRRLESGVGFSNGCAELTLKKPPPLVPSCLMAIWEAAGPTAICWWVTGAPSLPCVASTSVAVTCPRNVCTTPWETSASGEHERQRQQHVQRGARHVHPEVADLPGATPRQPADERHEDRHAARRRDEVLDGQREHLGEGAHGGLAAVPLPVRVGHERDRGVERRGGLDGAQPVGVERQQCPGGAAAGRPRRTRQGGRRAWRGRSAFHSISLSGSTPLQR